MNSEALNFNLNDSLKVLKINQILVKMREIVQCPICRSEMHQSQRLPCNHNYCGPCLSRLLETSKKRSQNLANCPLCKQEFSKRAIREDLEFNEIISRYHTLTECFERRTQAEILSQRPNF